MNELDRPDVAANYADNPPKLVPGFADMQRMALLLLSERTREDARVLVVGAGGGLELKAFATARPNWRFDGVDPSAEMLDAARRTLGALTARVSLHLGEIDVAPNGPFDGASCLLTLHFVKPDERLRLLREVRRRLRPGAPFVVAHHSIPGAADEKARWLARFAAFAAASGVAIADGAVQALATRLPILSPGEDEALLREAGFSDVALFYAAFTFRRWVARA